MNVNHPTRATTDGRAYLDLQNLARHDHRPTDEYVQFYALEGMLARLASSDHTDKFVLKGGALLAAYQARRPTRDIDFAATGMSNEAEAVLQLIRQIAQIPMDDGLTYDSETANAEIIRDEDQYSGVRVNLNGSLARARFTLHVDVTIGDPVWPAPSTITLPRLLGGQIAITGYPLAMVHAEKIVTAVERATANTRWRDFADIYLLSRKHPATGNELIRAINTVAEHRKATLVPLATALHDFPQLAQNRWSAWRRRQDLTGTPADFADLLTAVVAFADPAITGDAKDKSWDATVSIWQ